MRNITGCEGSMKEENLRIYHEKREIEELSEYASLSVNSKGRDFPQEKCDIRTDYQRDRDRILYCKAFRRLMHKTQVFLSPTGDHYSTRMIHTLEVAQVARTIARGLRLNEDLCEAIALGHDLGHTPFGHTGERALDKVCTEGFKHNEQSVRIVEKLEHGGEGLNLTKEVRDGMLNHKSSCMPSTLEGKIVRFADKMAYINHDIEDAIRAKIIKNEDIPKKFTDVLGTTATMRYTNLIHNIIRNSIGTNDVRMSDEMQDIFSGLRAYMFEEVYTNEIAKAQETKAENMVIELFEYYMKHFDELPRINKEIMEKYGDSKERAVCDYISGMTDRYAVTKFTDLIIPMSWGY